MTMTCPIERAAANRQTVLVYCKTSTWLILVNSCVATCIGFALPTSLLHFPYTTRFFIGQQHARPCEFTVHNHRSKTGQKDFLLSHF